MLLRYHHANYGLRCIDDMTVNSLNQRAEIAAHFLGLDLSEVCDGAGWWGDLDDREIKRLLIRIYELLNKIMGGHQDEIRNWMTSENSHLKGIPNQLIMHDFEIVNIFEYLNRFK